MEGLGETGMRWRRHVHGGWGFVYRKEGYSMVVGVLREPLLPYLKENYSVGKGPGGSLRLKFEDSGTEGVLWETGREEPRQSGAVVVVSDPRLEIASLHH